MMDGGTDAPEISPEERALMSSQSELVNLQRDIITRQVKQQELLAPLLLEEAGLKAVRDESGEIVSYQKIDDPNKALKETIERGQLERSAAALRGDLPVDPATERELGNRENILNETLRRQLGKDFATSGPGIEALARFNEEASTIRGGARRGDLSLAEQLSLARGASNSSSIDQLIARVGGVQGLDLGASGAAAQGVQTAGIPLSQMFQNRQLESQVNIANAQTRASTLNALFGAVGQGAGAYLGFSALGKKGGP